MLGWPQQVNALGGPSLGRGESRIDAPSNTRAGIGFHQMLTSVMEVRWRLGWSDWYRPYGKFFANL